MDNLSQLPIDIFIKSITYLPLSDVINVCQSNSKLNDYCINNKYKNQWKNLIDSTFGNIYGYKNKLVDVWNKLNLNHGSYNYMVYVNLIKELDPITQLMIYYRQKDMDSFNDSRFNNIQRGLALFLLGDPNLDRYLSDRYLSDRYLSDRYLSDNYYIDMLSGKPVNRNDISDMMIDMAGSGNVKGIKFFLDKGADINARQGNALKNASEMGYLDAVKYLVEHGANIYNGLISTLQYPIENNHVNVVKYLVEHGAVIDFYTILSTVNIAGLEIIKYLVEQNKDLNSVDYNDLLKSALKRGNADIIKYLLEKADYNDYNNHVLLWSIENGHLDIVKLLIDKSSYPLDYNNSLVLASQKGYLDIVKFLVEKGEDIKYFDSEPIRRAYYNGHSEVVKYFESILR